MKEKPNKNFIYNTNETNVAPIPAAIQQNGMAYQEVLGSGNFNDMLLTISKWTQYLYSMTLREIYISNLGSDTTGKGTESLPYLTIKKALDDVGANGSAKIILNSSTTFLLDEDKYLENCNVFIVEASGIDAALRFKSYTESGIDNYLNSIFLSNCNLTISVESIYIDNPIDTGKDWGYTAAIMTLGMCNVTINTPTETLIRDDSVATGGTNAIIRQMISDSNLYSICGFTTVNYIGIINTNDIGYVLDSGVYQNSALYSVATIDNTDYYYAGGKNVALKKNIIKIDWTAEATAGNFVVKYKGGTSSTIAYNATESTIKSAIETTAVFALNSVTIDAQYGGSGGLTGFEVTINEIGSIEGLSLSSYLEADCSGLTGVSGSHYSRPIQNASPEIKNINLITNLEVLK